MSICDMFRMTKKMQDSFVLVKLEKELGELTSHLHFLPNGISPSLLTSASALDIIGSECVAITPFFRSTTRSSSALSPCSYGRLVNAVVTCIRSRMSYYDLDAILTDAQARITCLHFCTHISMLTKHVESPMHI